MPTDDSQRGRRAPPEGALDLIVRGAAGREWALARVGRCMSCALGARESRKTARVPRSQPGTRGSGFARI